MWPFLGGLVSGGASLLGGMFSSDTAAKNTQANIAMQRETNQMSVEEAQKNRDFQQQMSSTAYQRSSQDMQQAGLNPMMMFGSGSAASTPGGSTPSLGTAKSENTSPWAGLGDAASKVVNTAISYKTFEKMTDEIANLKATNEKIHAETKTEEERSPLVRQQAVTEGERSRLTRHTATAAAKEAEQAERYKGMPDWLKNMVEYTEYGGRGSKVVTDAISSIVHSAKGVKSMRPQRSTTETSRQDSKGNWYDEFRENKSW